MRKLVLIIILSQSLTLFAQISEGGMPPSFNNIHLKSTVQVPVYSVAELDTAQLLAFDREKPTPMRYAVVKKVSLDLKSVAKKIYSDSYKGNIWQYRIEAKDAKSIQLMFSKYRVPDGAQLFIFDENYSVVRGAFTNMNITEDLTFIVSDFPGDYVIIEYFEPQGASFEGEITLGGIGQAYIDIFDTKSANADSYNLININCIEGKEWQDQKHGVCKITFSDNSSSYLCTGSLINNTNNDGTPYFLTANHCLSTDIVAGTVVAYFNYENVGCTENLGYTSQTLSGATVKTTGTESDYTLLLFNNAVPSSYKPYFNGWDITGVVTDSTAGIHHPSGKIKKICIDYDPSSSYESTISWEGGSVTPAGSHWQVIFDEGTTYGGSSGSPLFDENKRIIGQLHGGGSSDYYGKLDYSWSHPASVKGLNSFLAPGSSSTKVLNGYYPADVSPDAQFVTNYNAVCVSSAVEIIGYSAFSPTFWKWEFSPSTVQFVNGTTNESQIPEVAFQLSGQYSATLVVGNSAGRDTVTIGNIITAGSIISVSAYPSGLSDSCVHSFTGMNIKAYGAESYLWELSDASDDYFYIENNTANPVSVKLIDGVVLNSSINLALTLTGIQGTCQDTYPVLIPLEAQNNDNIANAIRIYSGKNGRYSNSCATIETGEPAPPATSCTGQDSWCNEYSDGSKVIENSVWFYYVPDYSQKITIYSKGFDNQMAVYKAATFADILSGNGVRLAANDDYSETDYNPKVTNLSVTGGQTYWIQVDGSAGGSIGNFYLYITILSAVEDVASSDLGITVYPQPACDNVFIESPDFEGVSSILVDLYNSSGTKVSSFEYTEGDSRLDIPLSKFSSGIYLARITYNDKRTTVKIVK